MSCFLGPSGLSWVGQEYFRFLTSFGFRVIPVWIMEPELRESLDPFLAEAMLLAASKPIGESPLQFHTGRSDELRAIKNRTACLASFVLEGNRLVDGQMRVANGVDGILVPTNFCRNACLSSGIPAKKIFRVSYPLDTRTWNPDVKPLVKKGDRYRFLYMNSWYERKGWDVLLRAWWQEFTADDPVELVIKSYRETDRQDHLDIELAKFAVKMGVDRSKKAPVTIIDQVLPAPALPGFMKSFDCYVSPHRSEGFGLNPWFAMALGVPVIATDYGGNTDFCKSDTSWLIRADEYTKPSQKELDIFPHLEGITWVEPSIKDLRFNMRHCMRYPDEAQRRARNGRQLVAFAYSYEMTHDNFADAVKSVSKGAWERLCLARNAEAVAKQPAQRFESIDKPLKMVEI